MNEKVWIVGRKVAKKVSYRPTIAYFASFFDNFSTPFRVHFSYFMHRNRFDRAYWRWSILPMIL